MKAIRWVIALATVSVGAFGEPVSTVPGPVTDVRTHLGRPTFFLNGTPYTKPLFATYVPTEHYYKQMASIGIEVFNFQTNCAEDPYGHGTPTWPAPDRWDFSQMDERANAILAAKQDAYILPRIYIEAPEWWRAQHPEALQRLDHDGQTYLPGFAPGVVAEGRTYGSIASPVWREAMAGALRKTVEHMLQAPWGGRVFGFELAALATEEWYPWSCNQQQLSGYEPAMATAFRAWLKTKYNTDAKLRAAWKNPGITLDTAEVPSKTMRMGDRSKTFRDPAREMPAIDFYLFYSDLVADTIDYFARVVKEATNRSKVVGAFYNYFYEFNANPEFGHNAGGRLLRSRNIDFVCAPPSYYERKLGSGVECYRRPHLSGTLHGKLWFHDNDLASFLFPKIMAKTGNVSEEMIRHHMEVLAVTDSPEKSVWLFERAAGFTLCEGIYESFFDLHGGYYDDPRLLDGMKRIADTLQKAANIDRSSVAQILVVADEASAAYGTFQIESAGDTYPNRINRALLAHQPTLIRCGAPFDAVYLDDLAAVDLDRYKLVVFLNTYHMNDASRALVNDRLKCGGRTLVWCYAPGYFTGNEASDDAMSRVTGITLKGGSPDTVVRPASVLANEGRQWMLAAGEQPVDGLLGQDERMCRLFYVDDPAATPLGLHADGPRVTLAVKKDAEYTAVYTVSPVLPTAFWRALARSAGVHLYLTTGDTFYANRSYLTINAASAGKKQIILPTASDLYDSLADKPIATSATTIDVTLTEGETAIYRYVAH